MNTIWKDGVLTVVGIGSAIAILRHFLWPSFNYSSESSPSPPLYIQTFANEKVPLRSLESYLQKHLVDQEVAIKTVCHTLLRQSTIWSNGNDKPLVFLFLGPPRVGKLYLARHVAQSQRRAFVNLDMRQFSEDEKVRDFVNANGSGKLCEILKKHPDTVIVLNNLEKACPAVFTILTKLFLDGKLWRAIKLREGVDSTKKVEDTSEHQEEHVEPTKEKESSSEKKSSEPLVLKKRKATKQQKPTSKKQTPKSSNLEKQTETKLSKAKHTEKGDKTVSGPRIIKEVLIDATRAIFVLCTDMNNETVTKILNIPEKKLTDIDSENVDDVLDRVVEFRNEVEPEIIKHFDQKCNTLFINRINAVIPFFAFSNVELANQILKILNDFAKKALEMRRIKLTWSEGVIIWLMLKYKPSIPVHSLIENHVLSVLAMNDHLIRENEHVHLVVGVDNKITVRFPNQWRNLRSRL